MKCNSLVYCNFYFFFFDGVLVFEFSHGIIDLWLQIHHRHCNLSFWFANLNFFPSFSLILIKFFFPIMFVKSLSSTNNGHSLSHHNNDVPPSSSPNKGYQNDTLYLYFIHPNENPFLVLVTPLLNARNYHSSSRSMITTSRSKNKIHFTNGAMPRPPDENRDLLSWDKYNPMIISWLNNSVESEIS